MAGDLIKLPSDTGEVQIIPYGDLAGYQADGWQVHGLINESELCTVTDEVLCVGSAPSGVCRHGSSGYCSVRDYIPKQVVMNQVRAVMIRAADQTIAILRADKQSLEHEVHKLAKQSSDFESKFLTSNANFQALEAQLENTEQALSAMKADRDELTSANHSLSGKHKQTAEENKKLRAHIHASAMAEVLGARELAGHGEWMSPVAFVSLLDSLENMAIATEKYPLILKEVTERRIIEVRTDERGTQLIRVARWDAFLDVMREHDATSRLSSGEAEVEEELAF